MSLLTTPSPRTTWCYQLQFNFKFRKSQTPLLLIKARGSNPGNFRRHNLRVHCVAQDEAKSGSGESERRRSGDSWINLNASSVDAALSDWFGNSDPDDSGQKNGIGGILGVGLAGVLLFAGITSAAISMGKRSSSRSVQEMKPLVEQQEVLLSSEEEVYGDKENVNDDKFNVQGESNGPTEFVDQGELVDDTNVESLFVSENPTLNDLDASAEDNLQTGSTLSDVNSPDMVPNSAEISQLESVDGSYMTSTSIDRQNTIVVSETEDRLDARLNDAQAGAVLLNTYEQQETFTAIQADASNAAVEPSTSVVVPIDIQNVDHSATANATLGTDSVPGGDKPVIASVTSKEDNEVKKPSIFDSQSLRSVSASRGIPAPSLLSAALMAPPGKVLVPAVADQTQSQALTALQVLKVIESDAQSGDLCTRREYARWLVSASSALSRNLILKVYPAMYIENVTELAFDDITPEDPDFSFIQGLAEAGLISSKLSRHDMLSSPDEDIGSFYFHPDSPLSRQDLVTWKMALEKRQLPEADRKDLHQLSGFIDIDRIDPDACPALVADLSASEQGIVALAFGYTRLFQPDKPVTKGQAAIALANGEAADLVSEELARIEAESIADKAVATHNALMAEVEKDINANFEMELLMEKEKIDAVQKMAEEAMQEVERLREEREEKNIALMKERATVDSEMEVLSKLRHELEEQLQSVMSNKVEISFEKERIEKLKKETEDENQAIVRLQYELEVERKALSMARTWAEDEARRVQEHARALEEARDRWERKGLKIMVDEDLREEASADITWTNVGKKMNSNPTEDDTDREEQAKAKRLARFKTEHDIVESERGDTIQRGQNVTKGKVPSITDRSVVEKQKSLGDLPSGSLENQDIDNEDLLSSSAIVGLCTDMCPESERGERERKGDLDQYERLDGDRNQTTETLAVKKYNRTAEREAELIRPLPILEKTMDYLLGLLDQPYDDRFLRLYNFMWDRMRAIRMDLRMQHIFNERAITMLEQMIRLHILAMHELCEFSKGEGFSEGFDAHLNIEQMNKTSVELFQMYDDHRKRGIFIPTEKEFRGYYALLKLDKHPGYKVEPSELSLDLANMTVEIRQTLDVLFARDVARSCRTANFVAFFRHARKASYLQACLMHAHFSKLRTQALASLHSGLQNNQGIPVAQVAKWLGMEGEDIESLLEYHGFLIKEFEEPYMVKEGPFLNDDKDYPTRCSTLVHRKKSDTIVKDVLSSHQVTLLPSEPRKELQSDKQRKNNHAAVKPLQTRIPLVSDDGLMDIEAVSSPIRNIQDQPSLEISTNMISRDIQSFMDPRHMVSAKSPKENIDTFASFQSNSMLNQPSPLSPRHGSFIADAGQLSFKEPPKSFPVQPFVPVANSSNFVWTRQDNFIEPVKSSLEVVVQSEPKSVRPEVVPAYVVKVPTPVSETDSSVVSSIQDNVSMKEMPSEELYDMQQKVDVDIVENYDEEVAEAKLRLLLRLWRRRSVRKKFIREQNRLAANVALSSLSLGPPIWQNQDKPTPCQKLNIDQAMNERYEKSQLSLVRWNVSDLVASKLAEKNENVNCICWKVISFSWLQHGMEARSPVSHLSLDEWLRYKLIPARKEESVENLVISAPGLSVWRKWDSDESGDLRCCLSAEPLAGAVMITFLAPA